MRCCSVVFGEDASKEKKRKCNVDVVRINSRVSLAGRTTSMYAAR